MCRFSVFKDMLKIIGILYIGDEKIISRMLLKQLISFLKVPNQTGNPIAI